MTETSENRGRGRLRTLLGAGAVLALAVLVVGYMMSTGTEAKRKKPERAARLVETTALSPSDYRVRIEAWGAVEAARRVVLQPQVNGQINAIGDGFEPGAHVQAGEVLVKIDPADYELAVRQRRSDLTRARAELAQEQGRRAVAEQEFKLVGGDATAAQKRLMLREPQLETARAAVASAKAALETAKLDLSRTEITAPFNALVLERNVDVGTRVANGTNLAVLAGTDAYWVELSVPAASLRWIDAPGATVRLYHENVWGKGVSREGRVIRLLGDLDQGGRMARLLVEVPDPLSVQAPDRPALLLGAFLRAEIEGRRVEGGFAIDRSWLRDGDTLWVLSDDGRLEIRTVEVLYRGADQVYLRDGLKAGERIVVSDLAVPVEGMPLRTGADNPAGEKEKPAAGTSSGGDAPDGTADESAARRSR